MHSKETKTKILNLYSKGEQISNLSKEFSISQSTIREWINKLNASSKIKTTRKKVDALKNLKEEYETYKRKVFIYENINCTKYSDTSTKEIEIKKFIELHPEFMISELCKMFDLPKGTYYNFLNRKVLIKQQDITDEKLSLRIKEIFDQTKGRLGKKKILIKLQKEGYRTSEKKVKELMDNLGLKVTYVKYKRKAPEINKNVNIKNILKRHFFQEKPNSVWVSDFTEIPVKGVKYHLCVIIDLFSRKVIAWRVNHQQNKNLIINTFKDAFNSRNEPKNLLFHSDQGSEFTSYEFCILLKTLKVKQSASNPGMPYDNAVMESFYSTLKKEEIHRHEYQDYDELKLALKDYINFYNNERPHKTLNGLTPNEFENLYYNKL